MDHLDYIRIHGLEDSDTEAFWGFGGTVTTSVVQTNTTSLESSGTATMPSPAVASGESTPEEEKAKETKAEGANIWGALVDIAVVMYETFEALVAPAPETPERDLTQGADSQVREMQTRSILPAIPIGGGWMVRLLAKFAGAAGGPLAIVMQQALERPDRMLALIEFGNLLTNLARFIVFAYDKYNENDDRERIIKILKNGLLHLPQGMSDREANYVSTLKKGLLELVNDPETNEETLTAYLSGVLDLVLKDYILKFGDSMELNIKAQALKY